MKRKELRQELKLKDVITGFSYSFTKVLLEKLKQLKKEDRVFLGGEKKAKEDEKTSHKSSLTSIAGVIHNHLFKQIDPTMTPSVDPVFPKGFEEDIKLAEEFLAIFEEEK